MTDYLKTDWDLNSGKLVELCDELPLWSAPFGLKLLEGIIYKKGIHVLDIGFGTGFPLTELAMRLGNDSRIYGIDPWKSAADRAEKKIDFYGIHNVEIIHGMCEDIPLSDDSIDLVVSNNGLNNVSDLDKSISECARILKPGGQFIQTMNLNDTMIEVYSAMKKVLLNLKLETCIGIMRDHIDKKRKPLDQYLEQLKSHGFSISSVRQDKFQYRFVDGTAMFNHFFIRLAFLDGWKSIVPADRQAEVFELIEKELNDKSAKDGILTLGVPFAVIDCRKL